METLRRVWLQQFVVRDDHLRWRTSEEVPPSALLIRSPYDVDARYSQKRQTEWTGYKAHLTETCDSDLPSLITNVETTDATVTDYEMTPVIHAHLAQRDLLPGEHLVDSGYMTADHLVTQSSEHGIDLVGPVADDLSWQAQASEGFASTAFVIDWQAKQARCPQGHLSQKWNVKNEPHGRGGAFPVFPHGVQRVSRPRPVHARRRPRRAPSPSVPSPRSRPCTQPGSRQKTEEFWQQYARRAGAEGLMAQSTARPDLRHARYIGLAKTHLQHRVYCPGAQHPAPRCLAGGRQTAHYAPIALCRLSASVDLTTRSRTTTCRRRPRAPAACCPLRWRAASHGCSHPGASNQDHAATTDAIACLTSLSAESGSTSADHVISSGAQGIDLWAGCYKHSCCAGQGALRERRLCFRRCDLAGCLGSCVERYAI